MFEFKARSNVGVLVEYLLLILWSNLFIDTNGFIIKIDERKVQFQWYRRNYISQKDLKLDCFFCNTLINHFWNLRRLLLMILIHKHFVGLGKMRDIFIKIVEPRNFSCKIISFPLLWIIKVGTLSCEFKVKSLADEYDSFMIVIDQRTYLLHDHIWWYFLMVL